MIESTRKLTAIKYAATLVGALAVVALAPATAHALPVNNNEGGGVSLHGQGRLRHPNRRGPGRFRRRQDRECRGGTIVVTTAPASAGGRTKPTNLPPKVDVQGVSRLAQISTSRQTEDEAVAQQFADGHGNVRRPSGEVLRLLGRVPRSSLAGQTSPMLKGAARCCSPGCAGDHSVHSHGHWSAPRKSPGTHREHQP
jgi:hypothetical protein